MGNRGSERPASSLGFWGSSRRLERYRNGTRVPLTVRSTPHMLRIPGEVAGHHNHFRMYCFANDFGERKIP